MPLLNAVVVDRLNIFAKIEHMKFAFLSMCGLFVWVALCKHGMHFRLPAVVELAALSVRTLIAERSEEQDRAKMMGYIGVAFGLGFAVGAAAASTGFQHQARAKLEIHDFCGACVTDTQICNMMQRSAVE